MVLDIIKDEYLTTIRQYFVASIVGKVKWEYMLALLQFQLGRCLHRTQRQWRKGPIRSIEVWKKAHTFHFIIAQSVTKLQKQKKTQIPNYNCLALITIKHFHFINHKNKVQAPQANDILQALEVALTSLSNQSFSASSAEFTNHKTWLLSSVKDMNNDLGSVHFEQVQITSSSIKQCKRPRHLDKNSIWFLTKFVHSKVFFTLLCCANLVRDFQIFLQIKNNKSHRMLLFKYVI